MAQTTLSHKRRLFNEIFNAAMCALILLPALVLIQNLLMPEETPWFGVLVLSPAALCFPAGRLLRNKERQSALTLGAVIAAACVVPAMVVFSGRISLLSLLFVFGLGFGCGIAMYLIPYVAGSNLASGKSFVAGLILYVAALAFSGDNVTHYAIALNACSIVLLVCGLFVFNLEGLRSATAPSGGKARFPKGMRRNNLIIIGVFVVLAIALANIAAIKDAAVAVGLWIINGVVSFLSFMGDVNGVPEGDGAMGSVSGDMSIGLTAEAHVASPLEEFLWNAFLFILIGAILVVLALLLYKAIRKFLARFGGILDKLLGRIAPQDDSYVDETEDLKGDKAERVSMLDRLRTRFAHKAKFGDMETDRARVRFAMREFLRKDTRANRSYTPSELEAELESVTDASTARDFTDAYNRARYSQDATTATDAATARKLVDRL